MPASRQSEGRNMALLAEASEAEIAALFRTCTDAGYALVRRAGWNGSAAGRDNVGPMLLVGAGRAEAARRWARPEGPCFSLLIAHDQAMLDCPELLARCENVLIAPYDEGALLQQLETLWMDDEIAAQIRANIAGTSPQMRELLRVMSQAARYDAPVLVKGETGTGKELVARGIHYSGARRDHPFVPVNCAALNDELLVAELFGYERGAFTDAKRSHRGLVAQAAGGTLFLDEIDSLSPKGQASLLRFLQEQEYRPIGSESLKKADVRVITATNKDLETLVARGCFREDLYYRVHLLDVEVPPLRRREGDVVVLAEHFLGELARRYGGAPKRLHPLTLRWMTEYAWPGNVRELQNYLHRVYALTRGPVIYAPGRKGNPVPLAGAGAFPPTDTPGAFREEKARALEEFERTYLHRVMQATYGNISLAARRAGKERRAFRRLLQKYGISRRQYEAAG